jgi:hypothetical protein
MAVHFMLAIEAFLLLLVIVNAAAFNTCSRPFKMKMHKLQSLPTRELVKKNSNSLRLVTALSMVLGEMEGFSQAFVGGMVGVMGMAFVVEARKIEEESLEGCPYCMGNGEILCGECLGIGTIAKSKGSNCSCSSCKGRGLVICINCKGDGRTTPIILQNKATRDPEYATKDRLNEFDLDSA